MLAGCIAFGAGAETAVIDYSYASGTPFLFGKQKKETIDVAMCINDPNLAGMKLTGFRAYISTIDGISSPSLWLSKELKIESKVNVPDIASYNVTPVMAAVGNNTFGMLSVTLEEPYVLTEEPLYLGYTINVDATDTEEQKNPIVLCENVNHEGFFLHMSKTVLKWLDYTETAGNQTDKEGGVAFIVASIEGDFPAASLGIRDNNPIYATDGDPFQAEFIVANVGKETVNSVKYSYSYDGGEMHQGEATLPSPLQPDLASTSVMMLPFEGVEGIGPHKMTLTVTEVNGISNENESSTFECEVNVIAYAPIHRPLVEEFTGLWCGWCPGGYLSMEKVSEVFPDEAVIICYHNDDPMEVTTNYPVKISGFPAAGLNRGPSIDPYLGTTADTDFGILVDIENSINSVALAGIEVSAELEEDIVKISTDVSFIRSFSDADYEIGYVLTANGLEDKDWYQNNYYPQYKNRYKGTPLEVLTTWPQRTPGLVFNDVAVDVSGMLGVAGSLPSEIVTAEEYTHHFSIDISGNEVIQNRNNLVIAAYVVDKANGGRIVNANKAAVTNPAGVESIKGEETVSTEYYDLTGRKVANPDKGLVIKMERMSDGTTKATKIMK